MNKRITNTYSNTCFILAFINIIVLCWSSSIFSNYQQLIKQNLGWLNGTVFPSPQFTYALTFQKSVSHYQNTIIAVCLISIIVLLWGMFRQPRPQKRHLISLAVLVIANCCITAITLMEWSQQHMFILNLSSLSLTIMWGWMAMNYKTNRYPPNYRYRALRPWALVALLLVTAESAIGSWVSVINPANCSHWPYCPSFAPDSMYKTTSLMQIAHQAGQWQQHLQNITNLGQYFLYHEAAAICLVFLIAFSGFLIFLRPFTPLRHLGFLCLALSAAEFVIDFGPLSSAAKWASMITQQGILALILITLVCIYYRVFAREAVGRYK